MRMLGCLLSALVPFFGAGIATAKPVQSPAAVQQLAKIPAGRLQPALALGRRGSEILAAKCSPRCNWANAVRLDVPSEIVASVASHVKTVKLGKGRRAAVLRVPMKSSGAEWAAVLVANHEQETPQVVFSGELGLSKTATATGSQPTQLRIFEEEKNSQVVLGRLDSSLQLCGRETLLEPKLLLPDDLQLHRVKLQRLSKAERDSAVTLTATPGVAQAPRAQLKAQGASSGAETLDQLLDGVPKSVWTETRSGSGMGEFVVLNAAPNVPVAVVNVTLPQVPEPSTASTVSAAATPEPAPPATAVPAAPTAVWLITDHSVFRVVFESGGSNSKEKRFQVYLPAPEKTSCIAIALDTASSEVRTAQVGLAEVSVTASLAPDQVANWVSALSEDAKTSGEPEASLVAVPELAAPAIRRQFPKLSERAQARALNVLDQWSCVDSVASYAAAWSVFSDRVAPRLKACGVVAAGAIAEQLKAASPTDLGLAQLLVALEPTLAVETLVPLLAQKKRRGRAAIRSALREVAERKTADPAIAAQLGAHLRRSVRLELLRALSPELPRFREVALPALKALLKGKASFRTRYLVIEPAAQLATDDAAVEEFITQLIRHDVQYPIRAHAVRSAPKTAAMTPAMLAAVDDPHVRVRAAAVETLGERRLVVAESILVRRLEKDPWPLVRAAAVRALARFENKGQSPASLRVNLALAETAELDPSSRVRRPALVALGQRGAREQLQVVRESFDVDADVHVRAAAAEALGALCDHDAVDVMTKKALQLGSLGASEETYILARSSLSALGRLSPPDLKQRLAPLFGEKTLRPAQSLARAALTHPAPCPARGASKK